MIDYDQITTMGFVDELSKLARHRTSQMGQDMYARMRDLERAQAAHKTIASVAKPLTNQGPSVLGRVGGFLKKHLINSDAWERAKRLEGCG